MVNEYIEAIKKTEEMIENLFNTKTLLQEHVLMDAFDHLYVWKNKHDDSITAYVVGINTVKKEVTIDTTNYKNIKLNYSEFMQLYKPRDA